jgi:hypothetical protein
MTSTRACMWLRIQEVFVLIPHCSSVSRMSASVSSLFFTAFPILPMTLSGKTLSGGTAKVAICTRQALRASLTFSIRDLLIGTRITDVASKMSSELTELATGGGLTRLFIWNARPIDNGIPCMAGHSVMGFASKSRAALMQLSQHVGMSSGMSISKVSGSSNNAIRILCRQPSSVTLINHNPPGSCLCQARSKHCFAERDALLMAAISASRLSISDLLDGVTGLVSRNSKLEILANCRTLEGFARCSDVSFPSSCIVSSFTVVVGSEVPYLRNKGVTRAASTKTIAMTISLVESRPARPKRWSSPSIPRFDFTLYWITRLMPFKWTPIPHVSVQIRILVRPNSRSVRY